jgi:serine/threonine protein kinase/TolB-like protein/Tfp pilus assembly protein PilF
MTLTPERWQQIARIYELAVDSDPATLDSFLSEACAGDEGLRREVESLLQQEGARVVLDRPVWATAAPLFDADPDLHPGTTLGPYRIEGPLGAGGMGEVFSGTDTRLSRRVAIKVLLSAAALDQHMRARFAREARAVAALTHPHICTLYDVGRHDQVDFLVMEYLEGETLASRLGDGQLALDEALTRALEIASALDHAHRQGIIHRDLKPGNIMLTASGSKLLDFGLAKFRATGHSETDALSVGTVADPGGRESTEKDDASMTRGGTVLGTLRYMAPEQIEGREVDARSDLFSFGALLYEMLTGKRAFEGDNAARVRAAILAHEPPRVSSLQLMAPPALDGLVRRCLAKNPDERWQTAADVLRELRHIAEMTSPARARVGSAWRWSAALPVAAITGLAAWLWLADAGRSLATAPASQIRAIAVLPLVDLSGDPSQEYFAEGMTDQLISDLVSIGSLRVISRTSAMHYKGTNKAVPVIAKELQVDGIIEGSLVRAGDRVRINATLIDGSSGQALWAQTFERDLRDVLALQREVARAITSRVDITLSAQQQARLASAPSIDPEVHRQILLGRHHAAKGSREDLNRAVQYFNVAIGKDSTNAMAHSGLAEAYLGLSGYYLPPREAMPQAKRAAETAIRLDQSLADAHATLGFIHLVYDWDGPAAEKSLLRALDLNPTLALARLHYAAYLTTQKRPEEAVREIQQAVKFDPVSIRTNALATSLLLFTQSYDEAIELARKGLEFEPKNAFALAFQGVAYAEQGRSTEAVANMERAATLDQSWTILSLQAHVLAVAGRKAEALRVIRQVEQQSSNSYFCPYEIGTAYVSLGDADTAHRWFRRGIKDRADCMAWLGVEPWMEPFRSDPRYAGMLREIGLDPSSISTP